MIAMDLVATHVKVPVLAHAPAHVRLLAFLAQADINSLNCSLFNYE